MNNRNRRKERRLGRQFAAMLQCRLGSDAPVEGVSENLSQGGALIKTKAWQSCRLNDQAIVTFFLPPDFTGQDTTIVLQGAAVVTRIDRDNETVGVDFVKNFRQFEQVTLPQVSRKVKYENLAYYLSHFVTMPLSEFIAQYPNGFLVEHSKHFFDRSVILQFTTEIAEDQHVLEQIEHGITQLKALKARVIAINTRHTSNGAIKVGVGRGLDNDIVLHNKMISRNHACIEIGPPERTCYVIDSGSANGTFINNNKIKPHARHQLADGDEISFGPETKVVYFSSKAFHKLLAELKSSSR